MKRIKKILLIMLMVIPFIVKADDLTRTYNETVTKANNYINAFENKDRYLIFGNFYGFDNHGATTNASFSTGGLISKKEFDTTINNSHSWLATGTQYWTQTPDSGLRWYIETRADKKADDRLSGMRVTQFVSPKAIVSGSGTPSNPWTFVGQYSVRVVPNRNETGIKVEPMYQLVQGGEEATVTITETTGIMYTGDDDCGLEFDSNVSKYVKKYKVRPTKDINCAANFDVRKVVVKYDCNGGTGSVADQPIIFGTNYTLAPKSCTRDGYIQTGWIAGSTNYSLGQTGTWTTEEGDGGVTNGKLNLKAVYNDVQSPKVTVTAYKYDSTKTNGLGTQLKDPITVYDTTTNIGTIINKTQTYVVSDSWLNHAVVFKAESTDNTGVTSITWRYNNANSFTDTGTSYPNSQNKGTTQVQYPSYNASGGGEGWRNGEWIVKDAKGNTTTIKLVAKIDTTAPTCSLAVTTSGVSINRNDNLNVSGYGLIKSTTPTYNSTATLALSTGDFYGYVKDAANNTGSCRVNLTSTAANKWTKKSEKCISYYSSASGTYSKPNSCTTSTCSTGGCSCGGYTASGTYQTTYSATASYSGTINCSKTTYSCPSGGTLISGAWQCQKGRSSYSATPTYAVSSYTGSSLPSCKSICSSHGQDFSSFNHPTCRCKSRSATCPSGYSLVGSTCYKYYCPSGWSGPSGGYCYRAATSSTTNSNVTCNTAAKYNNPSGQCSSGYSYTGNSCSRSYSCPNGGSRSGTTCYVSHSCTTGTCGTSGCSCYYTTASGTYYTTASCSTSTCSTSGCSCTTSYKFDTATNQANQTSCTNNTFACNSTTNGQTQVTCIETGWVCGSGYTKLNDNYCYR